MTRKKAVQEEAAEAAAPQTFDFGKSFQKLKPETFWQFLKEYPNWEAGAVYVYRLWPVIDRKLSGHQDKYLDVFSEAITEMDLLRKHGSGKYLLHFNDSNKPKGLVNVASCKVEIGEPLYEPVVPLEEIVEGADANKSYIEGLKARGKWKEISLPTTDNGHAAAEMAKALNNMINKMAERPPAPQEPVRQDPFDIALKIAAMTPKPSADPLELALKIVDRMQPQARQQQEVDPLETYGKVADIIESRASRYAGGGSRAGTDWGALALEFFKALPQLVQGFMVMRAMESQPMPAAAGPVPYPMPPVPATLDQKGEFMPVQTPDLPALFTELKPFLMKAMLQGQSGDEFAAGLSTFHGEDRYRQLASHGMDGLLGELKGHTEMWMMLSPHEGQVRTFIQDFLDYGKDEPEIPAGEAA